MMKYKCGDKILISATIRCSDEDSNMILAETQNGKFYVKESDIADTDGKTYTDGLIDAWNLACEIAEPAVIGGYGRDGLREMFGNDDMGFIFGNYTVHEVMKMTEQWKSEKEIHVGDVVVVKNGNNNAAVATAVYKDTDSCCLLWQDGVCGGFFDNVKLEKTGRHVDIEGLLKQIRDET